MKFKFFLFALVLLISNSCRSPKTNSFRDSIIKKERVAFQIILGKEGSETKKLDNLVKGDFKGALAAVDQQKLEFDKLIGSIQTLSSDGIQEGESLKMAAINYYKALQELHYFDRKDIEQQALIRKLNGKEKEIAQDALIELSRQKRSLYAKVYENEYRLSNALDKFDTANGF
ncbi:hypothetical protein [Epilithonimonas sp.]|uniref:hypothetical protein n=1 Tax=Epilithonimonas sp. TaxID=2894511 RepID=UPI0028A26AFA|nr:hypothetical protein [Epilithonimonas sp.]